MSNFSLQSSFLLIPDVHWDEQNRNKTKTTRTFTKLNLDLKALAVKSYKVSCHVGQCIHREVCPHIINHKGATSNGMVSLLRPDNQ